MSNRWAAIVYGRSYYIDFRFITIPNDFTERDTNWALQHILATTQQARNLADHPRWSLFKNDKRCIAGVTCMVRDLIGQLDTEPETITKDDRGRPLYAFVGYATQLNGDRELQNCPAYTESLDAFQGLYREIVKVWWVKNYERDSTHPSNSHYQPWEFSELAISEPDDLPQLNNETRHPEKAYLWPSRDRQNNLLWLASARCRPPTSTCLNIKGKALANSPFLNQTISQLDRFQIIERVVTPRDTSSDPQEENSQHNSISQKISHRAKEDIDLTLQQAAKVAIASQELINNFADWSNPERSDRQQQADTQTDEAESFGFKTKKSSSSSNERDWF